METQHALQGATRATAPGTRDRPPMSGRPWGSTPPSACRRPRPRSGCARTARTRSRRSSRGRAGCASSSSTAATCRSSWSRPRWCRSLIAEWGTAVLLLVLTVLNAVIGLRQEGKAESAMNALKSMMKATARVRRDGEEAEIPAEQLVVGDVVLLAAGDQVPADGRIVAASALQIDESALTGESSPAAKDARTLEGSGLGPGDQTDMAFMNTPVTHGSGIMIVTGTGVGHRAREDLGDAVGQGPGEDAAHRRTRPADPLDRCCGRPHDGRDARAGPLARRGLGRAVRQRGRPWRSPRYPRRCRR